jgi:hypothetical protein
MLGDCQLSDPELGRFGAHRRGVLAGNYAALSARRADVAAGLLLYLAFVVTAGSVDDVFLEVLE